MRSGEMVTRGGDTLLGVTTGCSSAIQGFGVKHNRRPLDPSGTLSLNSLISLLDLQPWKPILAALLLPPVPLLLLVLIGARLIRPSRGWGWLVVLLGVGGLWLSACSGVARGIEPFLLPQTAALRPDRIAELRAEGSSKTGKGTVAIVVLGSGVEPFAPEYGMSNLSPASVERLRYGLWLARETGWPVAFSGGIGWGGTGTSAEADVAARIAREEFGRPLRWVENESRDTRENAERTAAMLRADGIGHIVLVTHAWHMPRARSMFNEIAQRGGLIVESAPIKLSMRDQMGALDWFPSNSGFDRVRSVLREWLALTLKA
jgi:uncharacterized SAM-binding protein YcdF (DUF218 family)